MPVGPSRATETFGVDPVLPMVLSLASSLARSAAVIAPPVQTGPTVPAQSRPVDWPLKLSLKTPPVALIASSCTSFLALPPFTIVVTTALGPVLTLTDVNSPSQGSSVQLNFNSV